MNVPSYSKVYAFGHREIRDILDGYVEVEEKVDGSQFSMMKVDGKLYCRSRGKQIDIDSPDNLFIEAVETAKNTMMARRISGFTFKNPM